jgi:hypothetical protein
MKVEVELAEMTNHPNLGGAVLLGALAAVAGSIAWYGLTLITVRAYQELVIGIGWLVGKAVVLGSGDKRGKGLQVAAGLLAFAGVMGGSYLVLNHVVSTHAHGHAPAWLSLREFISVYTRYDVRGSGFDGLFFAILAVGYAAAYPYVDRLVTKAPTGVRNWRRWFW